MQCETSGSTRYQDARDTEKYVIPGWANYQEVRNARKYRIRKHKIPDTTKYKISRSTRYEEVRDAKKYEIPGRTKYTRMGDILGSHVKD